MTMDKMKCTSVPHWHLVLLFCLGASSLVTPVASNTCRSDELTVYKVTMETHWSTRDFPKHYPEWRPPAQWSKLIGTSHNRPYLLFRAGEVADPAIKAFAETGRSDQIEQNAQLEKGVLDMFITPPVPQGVGETHSQVFVDGNHSRISLISKIVPSPDWFVGVDSFELCEDGNWVDNVKIQVDPMDAGTDNGLTFTSPNWPTSPPEKIFRITSVYPNHPAHSFYYPTLRHLPRIATFTITKMKEYKLTGEFDSSSNTPYDLVNLEDIAYKHFSIDQNRVSYVTNEKSLASNINNSQGTTSTTTTTTSTTASPSTTDRRKADETIDWDLAVTEPGIHNSLENAIAAPSSDKQSNSDLSNSLDQGTRLEESDDDDDDENATANSASANSRSLSYGRSKSADATVRNRIPSGDAMAVIDDIVKNMQMERRKNRKGKKRNRDRRRRRRKQLKKIRPPRDCRVSDWSEWSPCSKTCGIGEMTRTRTILKHARRGGKVCPLLEETTWCGSARACARTYFNW